MLRGRAIGAIIGIISACSLFLLFIACCIVWYRRYLRQKGHAYVPAARAEDERTNENTQTEQTRPVNRAPEYMIPDSPPTYAEAIRTAPGIYN